MLFTWHWLVLGRNVVRLRRKALKVRIFCICYGFFNKQDEIYI